MMKYTSHAPLRIHRCLIMTLDRVDICLDSCLMGTEICLSSVWNQGIICPYRGYIVVSPILHLDGRNVHVKIQLLIQTFCLSFAGSGTDVDEEAADDR